MKAKIKITLKKATGEKHIVCFENESILSACIRAGEAPVNACGGNGWCGKCRMRLIHGTLPVTEEDKRAFDAAEQNVGCRLACRAFPKGDCTIRFAESHEDFQVISNYGKRDFKIPYAHPKDFNHIIIDIGTTTIAMQLLHAQAGKTLASYTAINPQQSYGLDVMARIQASNEGKGAVLCQLVKTALYEGIWALEEQQEKAGQAFFTSLSSVIIAGNTAMVHLLMGYSCGGLGSYPFTPETTQTIKILLKELLPDLNSSCHAVIMPAVSAFVGGDIVAGLLSCGFGDTEEINLFVDLGTNGEMAIGNKHKILTASTAVGPAFEGGNISCGTGSIAGAICKVTMESFGEVTLETIGNRPPRGLCGTGVAEVVYECLKTGRIDKTGLIQGHTKEIMLCEGIVFTQKDVREIQLAKAAICAGLETLLQEYGAAFPMIRHLYIAGGFGYQINIKKAAGIGLIPPELERKAVPVGNTSLAGAREYALLPEAEEKTNRILLCTEEVTLSTNKTFQEKYIAAMYFTDIV